MKEVSKSIQANVGPYRHTPEMGVYASDIQNMQYKYVSIQNSNIDVRRTKNKGTLEFLQELGVALQEELQQILRAEIRHIIFSMPNRCHAWVAEHGGHNR